MTDAQPAGPVFAEQAIRCFGGLDLLPGRLPAHRHVTDDLVVFPDRRGGRQHPVEIAILAAVLDQTGPRPAILEIAPEIGIGFGRHVRMTHDVVRLADQLILGETADIEKILVDVGDQAFEIGLGDDQAVRRQGDFVLGHRLVVTHESALFLPG